MNPRQAAFHRQAFSDWMMFLHPRSRRDAPSRRRSPGVGPGRFRTSLPASAPFPRCHELHYLQMCTEKLAKAYYQADLRTGHAAFRTFLRDLPLNSKAIAPLGFADIAGLTRWQGSVSAIAIAVEDLAPSIADKLGRPNPEYPWPKLQPITAPADYGFDVEVYDLLGAQARCGEPPFLEVLGRMIVTMQHVGWHL